MGVRLRGEAWDVESNVFDDLPELVGVGVEFADLL